MARKTLVSAVFMGMLLLVLTQGDALEFKCDKRNFPDTKCAQFLPFCQEYTAEKRDGQVYRLVCKACEEGFEPTEGKEVPFDLTTQMPDAETMLCRRDYALAPIYTSMSSYTRDELPFCRKYIVSELDQVTNTGKFICVDCNPNLYHSPVSDGVVGSLDPNVRKNVCIRNEGEYECGTFCQREFPGCERFRIFERRFVPDSDFEKFSWRAKVECLKPLANYQAKKKIEDFAVDEVTVAKDLVIPTYESAAINCEDPVCKMILPKCDVYYWVAENYEAPHFTCLQCSSGYRPKPYGAKGKPFIDLRSSAETLQLCDLEPTTSRRIADEDWMREFPGCDSVTVSKVYEALYGQRAVYSCDECGEGYEAVEAEHDLPVFTNPATPKYLCRPIQSREGESFECTNECRFKLPWCRRFSTRYYPQSKSSIKMMFRCAECDSGFTPVPEPWSLPQNFDWVVQYDVCEHIPTPEPAPCDAECQMIFPNCEQISILRDGKKKDTYHCLQCAEGYFPMDYEDAAKGMISNPLNSLRETSEVHLCSPQEDIIYTSKLDLRLTEITNEPTMRLGAIDSMCNLFAVSYNLNTKQNDVNCIECNSGYTLVPRGTKIKYQIDWRECVKTELSAKY